MLKLTRLILLLPLLVLVGCGAQWRGFNDHPELAVQAQEEAAVHELDGSQRAHGHRDFPKPFAVVWPATVETLHARGIGVPKSARPKGERAIIDLDGLFVLVEERFPGRVCVLLRFRALEEEEGRAAALEMLDEIHGRLWASADSAWAS